MCVYNSIRTDRDRREAARVCLELVVLKFCNYLRLHEKVIHCTTINESFFSFKKTITLARANSAARFDKGVLIYDSLFILLKLLTLNLHVDIGASISKLVSVHPKFCCLGGIVLVDGNPIVNDTINASLHPRIHCTSELCLSDTMASESDLGIDLV
jgi:hypothetical protein